jgi:CDP-glucose 4,6-dehydratase
VNPEFWSRKKVFLTGHTGFKGGWITHWLNELGAHVYGYAIAPPTEPNFFTETNLKKRMTCSTIGNILDLSSLTRELKKAKPDIVIHMAAQPLVRTSYEAPVQTFATNIIGTVNVLEASREVTTVRAIVNITTDKCYENKQWPWPYRESDRLGGYDPYSASKACAEMAAISYRNSFLAEAGILLASVRAGNVIGGGDWASDRLIPDFFRALDAGETLRIRSPNAIRPWQHVIEPLSGYLLLAERLYAGDEAFAGAWNFGPNDQDARSVSWIVEKLCIDNPCAHWETEKSKHPHEAAVLKLDISKAKTKLGWSPRWDLETALKMTTKWYQAWRDRQDMAEITSQQIQVFTNK